MKWKMELKKRCSGCGAYKELSLFYRNKSNKDGHAYKCSECMKRATEEYAQTDAGKEKRKAYRNSERGRAAQRRYQQSKRGKKIRQKNKEKHKLHIQARRAVNNAIRDGKFTPASSHNCQRCDETAEQYHHHSYEKEFWFDVTAFCFKCHRTVDKAMVQ